jgi:hypothetical protein
MPRGKELPNQSFHNPVELELLSINLEKIPQSDLSRTLYTPKLLSDIPDDDIIEVFI